MKLMLVTFSIDNAQFLINVEEELSSEDACTRAVQYAQEANIEEGGIVEDPDYGLTMEEVMDAANYEVEDVDFGLLKEMFKRDDYMFSTAHTIVFNG